MQRYSSDNYKKKERIKSVKRLKEKTSENPLEKKEMKSMIRKAVVIVSGNPRCSLFLYLCCVFVQYLFTRVKMGSLCLNETAHFLSLNPFLLCNVKQNVII
jgi:hypothetical protein